MTWNMTLTFHVSKISKINQHKCFPPYYFCSKFHKKIILPTFIKISFIFICHPKFHPWIYFIHEHMEKYFFTSPNILSHVSNNILQILCRCQQNIRKWIHPCSLVHAHMLTLSQNNILGLLVIYAWSFSHCHQKYFKYISSYSSNF
jgi:hypothetical protein